MNELEQTTENQPVMGNRERLLKRFTDRYPDRSIETDDDLYGAINEDYEGIDQRLKGYEDNEQKILKLFNSGDPRGSEVFQRWRDGENPIAVIIELFGDDAVSFIEDPENKDAFETAYQKWSDRKASEAKAAEKDADNAKASLDNLDKVKADGGYSQQQAEAAFDMLMQAQEQMASGVISEETWRMALNAVNHDRDVATARDEGNVAGRNANIQERLRKPSRSTEAPMLGSGNGSGLGSNRSMRQSATGQVGDTWSRGKKK